MENTFLDNIKIRISRAGLNSFLTITFGCLVIVAWTLIRLFDGVPNFDQLGQQVLAHQWLHGLGSGSVIGPTNYVLKMLFLYIPFDFLSISAQLKLIIMTLLINIGTFLLLVLVLKRLWLEFYPDVKDSFYLPLVYLSLISGSVYWISFTNSRNLEVVGGVFLTYLYIKTQKQPSFSKYSLLIIVGSLLFFADPLQMYMSLIPVLVFISLMWVIKLERQKLAVMIKIFGCAVMSLLFARLLAKIVGLVWHTSFITTGHSAEFSVSSVKLAAEQMARLYTGGFEGGRLRETINLLVVAVGAVAASYYYWRQPKSRKLLSLVTCIGLVNLGVYIVSGQAQQAGTNRYLIMTVPMFILALAAVIYHTPSTKLRNSVIGLVLFINITTLAGAFVQNWNPHFSNNDHDRAVISYVKRHGYKYGYASISTAISSDYLSNWRVNLLTLGCEPNYTLKQTNLFFDKAAFKVADQASTNTSIPVVLDGDNIRINQTACKPDKIKQQFGQWQRIDHLSDGSTVLIYKTAQLNTALSVKQGSQKAQN